MASVSAAQRPDLRGPVRYLVWLARCQLRRVLAGAFYGSAWMITLALPPYLLSHAVDDGLKAGNSGALWRWTGALAAVGLVNAWLAIARHRTMSAVRIEANFRTTRLAVDQIIRLGAELPRRVSAGEVVTVGLGDVVTIAAALTVTGPGIGALVAYTVIGVLLWTISSLLAIVVLLGVPALAVMVGPLLNRLLKVQTTYREVQTALSERLVDLVEGLRVLNAFGGKAAYASRYRTDSDALRESGYRVAVVTSWINGLAVGLPTVFLASVIWLGARMTVNGTITIGQLVAVYGYAAMLAVPVANFVEGGDQVSRALVSARRLLRFLSLVPAHEADHYPADPPAAPAELADPESGVVVPVGQFTALVSARPDDTIAVLERLAGFTQSAATWGGVPLRDIAPQRVRPRIVLADNNAMLFAGSMREVLADHGTHDDAIATALHTAAAEDVVQGRRYGLAAHIEQGGTNLSGGQRQRMRLARVLLADPEVLLAVEPTSALDAHTEALVAERVRARRATRTTVFATSSPLVLARADLVCLLGGGRVVATGTHHDLLATREDYRDIVMRDAGETDDEFPSVASATAGGGT